MGTSDGRQAGAENRVRVSTSRKAEPEPLQFGSGCIGGPDCKSLACRPGECLCGTEDLRWKWCFCFEEGSCYLENPCPCPCGFCRQSARLEAHLG